MKNILVSLLVLFSTILSAAPQSKSGQVGFYQATGVAGTNRFLWDRTNDWLVLTHGALVFGTNKPAVVAEIIRAISDSTAGDPSARTVTIEANETGAGAYGGALLNVNNAGDASFTMYNHLAFEYGVEFNIRAADGVTPFTFNATINHTTGSLFSVSNLDRDRFDISHDGMIWSATNKFAFATTTNRWPLTNALAGQLLTSAGGAGAQLYWSTVSASGPSFADLVWTNSGVIETLAYGTNGPYYSDDGAGSTFFRVNNSNTNGYGRAEIGTYNDGTYAEATLTLSANTNGPNSASIAADVAQDFAQITISFNGSYVTRIDPTAADGTTSYIYDTSLAHTSGNLNEWKNFGVTHLTLASTNGISTPAITAYGAGSAPWQFGRATNMVNVQLTATNVLEFVVNGVSYLVPASLK